MARAHLIVGLLYGDEGKGSITDHVVRRMGARAVVVRYNGGAQAAHTVVLSDGRHHTFAQWGAGTFAGARTFLSRHMITHPLAMLNEAAHLRTVGVADPWSMLTVDERALVITPYHQWANQARENQRGDERHGSCGMGVGEAYVDRDEPHALRFGDLLNAKLVREKLESVRDAKTHLAGPGADLLDISDGIDRIVEKFAQVARLVTILPGAAESEFLASHQDLIFEGAQGVLLDQFRGVQPWTTWSNTTSENARAMLDGLDFEVSKIGVLRAYVTRHGPGPLATFDEELTAKLPDVHNGWNRWQRGFRCGWFDAELAKHAIQIEGGIDRLALTNVDRLAGLKLDSKAIYDEASIVEWMERQMGRKVSLLSRGPTADDKEER